MKKKNNNKKILIAIIIVVIAVITIVLINNMNKNNQQKELAEVEEYVKINYLNEETLNSLENNDKFNNQGRINAAIISINRDNGSKLPKISEEEVAKKYKNMYNKEMKITEISFLLPNGYKYNYDDKSFEIFVEVGDTLDAEDLQLDNEEEKQGEITTITSCEKNKDNQYEIKFEKRNLKSIDEIIEYANQHQDKEWDMDKLKEIASRENTEEDNKYLIGLINDKNREDLTVLNKTGKITVKKNKKTYTIENYEI